jgi:LacI family transcriptional regulator
MLQERLQGYLAALRDAGLESEPHRVRELYLGDLHLKGETFEEIGERHIVRWMKDGWKDAGCTAIIAQNDATARGMMTALQKSRLRVPDDVSVAGFDGLTVHAFEPKLTTMEMPLFDLGQTAVRVLCDWLESPAHRPDDIALPGRLLVGDTTAPPRKST